MQTQNELRATAKNAIEKALSVAHFEIEKEGLTEEEEKLALQYLEKYATKALKAIGCTYSEWG